MDSLLNKTKQLATQYMSAENTFVGRMLNAYRMIALVGTVIVIAVTAFIFLLYLFSGSASVKAPTYQEVKNYLPAGSGSSMSHAEEAKQNLKFAKLIDQLNQRILKIAKDDLSKGAEDANKFLDNCQNSIISTLDNVPDHEAENYLDSLDDFIKDARRDKPNLEKLSLNISKFGKLYLQKIENGKEEKEEAQEYKTALLGGFVICFSFLAACMVLITLLQIERNTRASNSIS